jgi:hypothetical protein
VGWPTRPRGHLRRHGRDQDAGRLAVSYPVENAVIQWEDGYRRLETARSDPATHRVLGRAVLAVEDELRKRLGSTFSIEELASLYREDSDWGLELTIEALPDQSRLWDTATVVDAAFYLYMREAADFAAGKVASRP